MHPKHCGYVSDAKQSHLGPIFNFASFRPVSMVSRSGKVMKIRLKYFSAILTREDKNCTTNNVGMFRMQNQVICAKFSTFPALVLSRPEKVIKILPKYFSAVRTRKDKNCTPNIVGIVRVQNRVIQARFVTLPAPGLF